MISKIKDSLINNLKNSIGWKTKRKIVVFSVDDYGNVRLHSAQAREVLDKAGLKIYIRYDSLDTLETREDLEMLFDTLTSVKDTNSKPAVFTPFALPCNINFSKIIAEGFTKFYNEPLPETFNKLAAENTAYQGAWQLWQEGMRKGLMTPQFHGREHLNLHTFNVKLNAKDHELLTCLKNQSLTSIADNVAGLPPYHAAFDFWKFDENLPFEAIIKDGLNQFEKVFGYRAINFNSPGGNEHHIIHNYLKENGIKYIDTPFLKLEHQGEGKYKKVINFTGKRNNIGQTFMVRNVVFEPCDDGRNDWVTYALKQIETAFKWNKPAIISSHRVNFCGHISPENRNIGINALKDLLNQIVKRWPDVEFMAANELGNLINKEK